MALGMTPKEYWFEDCTLAGAYVDAYKRRMEYRNQELWLQGLYIYDAFGVVMANAFAKKGAKKEKYMAKPIELFKKEQSREEAQAKVTEELKKWQAHWKKIYGDKNKHT